VSLRTTCTLILPILFTTLASCATRPPESAPRAMVTDTTCADSALLVRLRGNLLSASAQSAKEELRDYSWRLFGEVTGPGENRPKWTFGRTVDSAGIASPPLGIAAPRSLFQSLEFKAIPEADPLRELVTVLMNDASMRHLESNKLYVRAEIEKYRKLGVHQIPEFGCDAINVKASWRVVPRGQALPIGIWIDSQTSGGTEDTWGKWIQVDGVGGATASTRSGGHWDPARRIMPDAQLQDFYSVVLGSPGDFLSAGLTPDLKTQLHPGDSLILVGLHVAAKRDADWIWTTFWWTPDNISEPLRSRMPAGTTQDRRWHHLAMNVDVSMLLDAFHPPVFNPYIEGTTILGPSTNCMGCHKNASSQDAVNPRPKPPDFTENTVQLDYVWALQRILSDKSRLLTQR
jgi:hypothetical protein